MLAYDKGETMMSETINLHSEAMDMLRETSRTFFIPISLLSEGVQEAVASGYLCMRAIDEIEDHEGLPKEEKSKLLVTVSQLIENKDLASIDKQLNIVFEPYRATLPPVTLRLADWLKICPKPIAEKIFHSTAVMGKGMAKWVEKEWKIETKADLDEYTYYVAGLVGEMLSDIWDWHDNIETDKGLAIAFGRGLQSVNILRNRSEDLERGVDFFPNGREVEDMFTYAEENLAKADQYLENMKKGEILHFCKIPLALAHGTLQSLMEGKEKLSRADVTKIVSKVVGE